MMGPRESRIGATTCPSMVEWVLCGPGYPHALVSSLGASRPLISIVRRRLRM